MRHLKDVLSKNYLTLNQAMTVKEAMKKIVSESVDETLIDVLYVIDAKKKLIGVIDLKELIIARATETLESVMEKKYPFVYEHEPISKAIDTVQNYDKDMIPIINKQHQLLGVLTASEALDLLADETLEDYHKMASLTEYDVHSKPLVRSKKRLPWLLILLAMSLITATVLSIFEETIQTIILLVLFQPMILDAAGNISTQSLAKTIIVINEKPDANLSTYLRKEILIGFINSVFVAFIGFTFSLVFLLIFQSNAQDLYKISLTVGITLWLALMIGALTGAFIPLWLRKLKIDPSVASGPFMTTLNDVISLVIYFTLATIILIQ